MICQIRHTCFNSLILRKVTSMLKIIFLCMYVSWRSHLHRNNPHIIRYMWPYTHHKRNNWRSCRVSSNCHGIWNLHGSCIYMMHDDVIKWKHFTRYWPFVRGIHRSPVKSPHKGQWRGALMFSLICAWINGWVNNREAGDLRRHRTHYDVTVMFLSIYSVDNPQISPRVTEIITTKQKQNTMLCRCLVVTFSK